MSIDDRYERGSWSCAYRVSPVDPKPTPQELLTLITEIKGHETGWPVWLILHSRDSMRPRIVDGVIECWLHETEDEDFWRADPAGRMFLVRRLQEDTREIQGMQPGQFFEFTLPVWRAGECLLHASRLAERLGADKVDLEMTWRGLEGRELSARVSPDRALLPGRICHEKTVTTSIQTDAAAIGDTLPDLVKELVAPLFSHFDFFEPPPELYATEVERMRRGV